MKDALGSVQSVLVLGGTSEIGLAVARALAAERTRRIVLAARDPSRLTERIEELRRAGAETIDAVAFDADEPEAHPAFVEDVFDRHGDIDLVLVAFGVLGSQEELARDPVAAAGIARTNYVGAVSVTTAVVERLRRQGHGTLVFLSSVAGERARKSNYVYGSSKAGLDAFAQGLGDALAGSGVNVMVVRPGFVHTKMTAGLDPAPFSTTPEAVAEAIVRGLRTGAHTVWAPPVLRFVMSALRHLPRPIFRRLNI
ncbi:MAG: decaprenylphospho-beta-D-erythro-pentofuranosid-2-ulose 2-reductase [Thermoleophilaceae bacterium]